MHGHGLLHGSTHVRSHKDDGRAHEACTIANAVTRHTTSCTPQRASDTLHDARDMFHEQKPQGLMGRLPPCRNHMTVPRRSIPGNQSHGQVPFCLLLRRERIIHPCSCRFGRGASSANADADKAVITGATLRPEQMMLKLHWRWAMAS